MAKSQQFIEVIDGQTFNLVIKKGFLGLSPRLEINGSRFEFKQTGYQVYTGVDKSVMLASKEARFVCKGNVADIAIDGIFLGSGEPYLPARKLPWWTWIFFVACAAIPILTGGGALPAIIGLLGARFCMSVALSPRMKTLSRVAAAFAVTVSAWSLLLILAIIMTAIKMSNA